MRAHSIETLARREVDTAMTVGAVITPHAGKVEKPPRSLGKLTEICEWVLIGDHRRRDYEVGITLDNVNIENCRLKT